MNKTIQLMVLSVIIFGVAIVVPSYSFMKKGFAPGADYLNLIQARNFALGGTYAYENSLGVFLASEHAQSQGIATGITNPLTAIIYGQLFRWFGFHANLPFYLSIIFFGFFSVALFLLVSRIFGMLPGFFGALTVALVPVMVTGALSAAFYEWAILFFAAALWVYLGSSRGPFRTGLVGAFIASILFALAALARNAFAISFVPIFLYDFWLHRSYKRSVVFLLPFLIVFGLTLTPYSWLGAPNGYTAAANSPFQQIGHIFNDPYSYHFNQDVAVQRVFQSPEALDRVAIKFAGHYGYKITPRQHIQAFIESLVFYITAAVDLIIIGGPLVWLLMIFGSIWLWRHEKQFFGLIVTWLVFWLVYLVWDQTGNWDHFIELVFPIAVLSGIGASQLIAMLVQNKLRNKVAIAMVAVVLIGNLGYATRWRLHETYRSSIADDVRDAIEIFESFPASMKSKTIMFGRHPEAAYGFAYYTDHDTIYFHPDTVRELYASGKLRDAMRAYNVSAALGYSPDIMNIIRP